jgi:hypothetical protein
LRGKWAGPVAILHHLAVSTIAPQLALEKIPVNPHWFKSARNSRYPT